MVGCSEDADSTDDLNGGDNASSVDVSSVSCSICLDLVIYNAGRSTAKLLCGHEFHLDCIGSAFNSKGAMQCPNCRKVERGRWLFASGCSRSFPEFSVDEWAPDEDPYELSYNETPFRVHWCPFSGLTRVHSSFEEVESPQTAYHNLQRHHAIFTEHAAASSVAHSYVAYFRPIQPAPSNTHSTESVEDPNFNHRWNGISGHNEIFAAHAFPVIDVQYQNWGHHSHPLPANSNHINSTDQASVPPARSTRGEYDAMTRSGPFLPPFHYVHGSIPRGGSSFFSSVVQPGSNSWSQERVQASHAIHHQQQQQNNPPGIPSAIVPGVRRFSGLRSLPQAAPATSQSDHSGGFFIFPPPGPSGQNLHETENSSLNHGWERDHLSHLPVLSFDGDSGWGSFHRGAGGGSDSTNRSGNFWHRH